MHKIINNSDKNDFSIDMTYIIQIKFNVRNNLKPHAVFEMTFTNKSMVFDYFDFKMHDFHLTHILHTN